MEKPTPATRLDVLINLRNRVLERLTFAQVDYQYFNTRRHEIKGKSQEAQAERMQAEQSAKENKKTIAQDTLLLSVIDEHMAEAMKEVEENE